MSELTPAPERALTPPQVARFLGVSADKVLAWVRSGSLRAVNVASAVFRRPRYRVLPDDLAAFLRARQAGPPPQPARRRRKQIGQVDYYPD